MAPPPIDRLPSPARLRRSAAICVVAAIVIYFVVVVPAERGLDPTGLGGVLGLTEMGMIKQQFKAELEDVANQREARRVADSTAIVDKAAILASLAAGTRPARTDTTKISVKPGEEVAVEFQIRERAWTVFEWSAEGIVNFDVRGDTVGAPDWWYYRYEGADSVKAGTGVLIARFSGVHGFYWKNDHASPVAITLVTRGSYSDFRKQ